MCVPSRVTVKSERTDFVCTYVFTFSKFILHLFAGFFFKKNKDIQLYIVCVKKTRKKSFLVCMWDNCKITNTQEEYYILRNSFCMFFI